MRAIGLDTGSATRPLDGQAAIVTGAGRGLGRSHAIELARRGASVVVNDVTPSAEAVAEEIRASGGRAVASRESVTTADGGVAIVQAALDAFGTVDIVVNNAGFARNATFSEMTIADFDAVLDVHLRGAFFVTQPAWRVMERQGYGRVVMTSSGSGVFGRPAGANYCSAKAALVGLTKALAAEGEASNIQVNCLLPVAATEFVVESPLPPADLERLREVLGGVDGRKEPERVTALAVFLSSPECEANGQVYSACLGRYALGFFGVTGGWVSPGDAIPSPDTIGSRFAEIEAFEGIIAPASVFDEMGAAARAVTERLASG
jgi:NAD(P)-dependent dehydrogenase (short-subunit alcohol dehydrogenase family)